MTDSPVPAITIVGLGPGAPGDLTLDVWTTLAGASRILLRTSAHPCVSSIPATGEVESCDDLYEAHTEFADVYRAIVDRVFNLASLPGGVVYAVPGHPLVGEATTRLIVERAAVEGTGLRVAGGISFIEPCFAAMTIDPMDGAQVVDAMLLARQHHPRVETGLPLLVAQVYARWLASDLKLTLLNAYPPEHQAFLVGAAWASHQVVTPTPLHRMDHADHDFDPLTTLYVPPLEYGRSFTDLQEIVAHLRAADGCPWDRAQTLESLRQDLLGECAEVLEAIDIEEYGDDNSAHIAEELGDLFMSATMMVQIATEEGRFQMADATHTIVSKLIRRHPHVFGDVEVDGVEKVLINWDAIKAQEKAAKGIVPHPLDGVPAALPALEKARELQSKAAKAGMFDRRATAQANPALADALGPTLDSAALGRALWQMVALAAEKGINAEDALRAHAVEFRRAHESRAETD